MNTVTAGIKLEHCLIKHQWCCYSCPKMAPSSEAHFQKNLFAAIKYNLSLSAFFLLQKHVKYQEIRIKDYHAYHLSV